jgi:hypothetical protein
MDTARGGLLCVRVYLRVTLNVVLPNNRCSCNYLCFYCLTEAVVQLEEGNEFNT